MFGPLTNAHGRLKQREMQTSSPGDIIELHKGA